MEVGGAPHHSSWRGPLSSLNNVVFLFTILPIKKAMEVIRKKLEGDNKLSDRTNLDAYDVMSHLEFMMSTMYFQFDSQY